MRKTAIAIFLLVAMMFQFVSLQPCCGWASGSDGSVPSTEYFWEARILTGPDFIRIDARLTYPTVKEYKLYVELIKRPNPGEDTTTPQCSEKILVATYKVGEKCLTKSKVIYNLSKDHGYTAKFSWDYDYLNTIVPVKCAKTYFYTNSLCKFP